MINISMISVVLISIFSAIAGLLGFPFAIRFGKMLGLLDKPNHRKLHRKPTPVVGGFGIGLCLVIILLASAQLQQFILLHWELFIGLFAMLTIGIFDDKFSLSVKFRILVELGCAYLVAHSGMRIHSFHGIFGINELPVVLQYSISMFLILAITNAFNLMDGIDGLVGGIAIVNLLMMMIAFMMLGEFNWVLLFIPLVISILFFLKYNWSPAKIFMGDAGSLMLGFLFASCGVYLIDKALSLPASAEQFSNYLFIAVSGCLMIPSIDTLRVFYQRAKQGKSPFSADRTHLHHLFLQLNLSHARAAKKIITLHMLLIAISLLFVSFLGIGPVIILQIITAVFYTAFLKFVRNYFHWFRFIKKYELE